MELIHAALSSCFQKGKYFLSLYTSSHVHMVSSTGSRIDMTMQILQCLLIEFKIHMTVCVLKCFQSCFGISFQNCLLVATNPTPRRFILHSHRALRLLISPTEHEHSAVCVLIQTAWLLYRLLLYIACCQNQDHKNGLSFFGSVCCQCFSLFLPISH